jgi:hypothetical protein
MNALLVFTQTLAGIRLTMNAQQFNAWVC